MTFAEEHSRPPIRKYLRQGTGRPGLHPGDWLQDGRRVLGRYQPSPEVAGELWLSGVLGGARILATPELVAQKSAIRPQSATSCADSQDHIRFHLSPYCGLCGDEMKTAAISEV